MKTLERKVLEWLATGNDGESSKAMAFTALGIEGDYYFSPADPGDFNRCLMLLEVAPEIRKAFPEVAKISSHWENAIKHWDEVEQSFLDEVGLNWCKGDRASITYAMMKEFGF